MRVGILLCDHVLERYLPIAGDYIDMFTAMVAEAHPGAEVVPYDAVRGQLPAAPNECDAWICTGSSASVYDEEPWITALSSFVRAVHDGGVPLVGICFGHQLIAHALGGRTTRAEVGWGVGSIPMDIVANQPWMTPPLPTVTLLYSHQDQVTELPPGGAVLAATPNCPIAMFGLGDDILGIQAHPELGAPYVRALLVDRIDRIGEAGTAAALTSLAQPIDERTMARWIGEFLRSRVRPQG